MACPKKFKSVIELFTVNYKQYAIFSNEYIYDDVYEYGDLTVETEKILALQNYIYKLLAVNDDDLLDYICSEIECADKDDPECEVKLLFYRDIASSIINIEYNNIICEDLLFPSLNNINNKQYKLRKDRRAAVDIANFISMEKVSRLKKTKSKNKSEIEIEIEKKDEDNIFKNWERQEIDDKYKYYRIVCPYCNMSYINGKEGYMELDHIFNKSLYPALTYMPYNLIPSCKTCNQKKSDKDIPFTLKQISLLHNNLFIKDQFNFSINNLQSVKKACENILTDNIENNEKIDQLVSIVLGSTIEDTFIELNISKRYETLMPIVKNINTKFERNKQIIVSLKETHSKIDENETINAVMGDVLFHNIFDNYTENSEAKEYEVIFYFKQAYLKKLLKMLPIS